MDGFMMDRSVDQINYFAIELLEQLGNYAPSEPEIKKAEALLSLLGLKQASKFEWLRATSMQFSHPLFTRHRA